MTIRQLREAATKAAKKKKIDQLQKKQMDRLVNEMRDRKIAESLANNGEVDPVRFYKSFDHRRYRYLVDRSKLGKETKFTLMALDLYVKTMAKDLERECQYPSLTIADYKRIVRETLLGQPKQVNPLSIAFLKLG